MTTLPILSRPQVRNVADDAKSARHKVVEAVRGRAVEKQGVYYWGQFLVGPAANSQLGVYGTAAGAEILARNGETANVTRLCAAMAKPTMNPPGFKGSDAHLVHKVAAVVSAAATIDPTIELADPAVARLIELQLSGGGWCGYDTTKHPNAVPGRVETATALLALAKVTAWLDTPTLWVSTLGWLIDHLPSGTDLEEAIGLLAVRTYQPRCPAGDWEGWDPMVRSAQARTAGTLRSGNPVQRAVHHYVVKFGGSDQNKYMLYVQDVVAALALLVGPASEPVAAGAAVTATVRTVTERILAKGALELDDQRATVDQLWADRLLEAFVARAEPSPGHLLPEPVRLLRSSKGRVRLLVGGAGAAVLMVAGVVAQSDAPGTVQGPAFVVSGLGLTALGSAFTRRVP